MEVNLSGVTVQHAGEYKLSKKIDNNFIVEELETDIIYLGDDYEFLLRQTATGGDEETGNLSVDCGATTVDKDIFIKHNQGKFNLRDCEAIKEISIVNPLDCIAGNKINIFDYARSETGTIEGGSLDNARYEFDVNANLGFGDYNITTVLAYANIPDRTNEGFYIQFGEMTCTAKLVGGQIDGVYASHEIKGFVEYNRIRSATQLTDDWLLIDGGTEYYYSNRKNEKFFRSVQYTIDIAGDIYTNSEYLCGRSTTNIDTTISNTIEINSILSDLFTCTGLTLISNFLNIAPDSTAPNNSFYEYASAYLHNLKIVQAYDIIKEDAENDSFGYSGVIEVKKLFSNLFKLFNLIVVVDGVNIRLEHVSYFYDKGVDLTGEVYELDEFEINKEKINKETWLYAQPTVSSGFYSQEITYSSNNIYKEDNDVKTQIELFVTDVIGLLNNPEFIQSQFETLFFLLSTNGTEVIALNSALSMSEIVKNLHTVQRPMKTGLIDGEIFDFQSYSVGLEGTIKIDSNISVYDLISPLMSIQIKEGTFLIKDIEFGNDGIIEINVKK